LSRLKTEKLLHINLEGTCLAEKEQQNNKNETEVILERKTAYPVLWTGGRGTIQPSSKALSMMAHSMLLMDTGFSIIPRTQEPSQGAGHTRPVNSGKLFVSRSLSNASRHLFWYTNSLNSGILFPRGHPEFS